MIRSQRTRHRGFTLVELMVAVAIVGLLAAIALPSYRGYVLRSQRANAKAFLTQAVAKQESWFNDRKTYAGTLSALGYAADTLRMSSDGSVSSSSTTSDTFSVAVSACTPACNSATITRVAITATAVNRQTSDSCATLVLATDGSKTATGSSASECWKN